MKGDSSSRAAARIEQIQNSDVDDTTKKLAIQKVYEDEGVSFADISDTTGVSGGHGKQGFNGIHGSYDNDGNIHFTRYKDGSAMNDTFSGQLDGSFARAKYIHGEFLNWAGHDLSTSGSALGFSSMMYNHRIDTQQNALAMSSAERQAIYESRMRSVDLGRPTGAIIDMNDSATRMAFARNEGFKTTQQLQSTAINIISAVASVPLFGSFSVLAGRGLVSLGRVSMNMVDDVGRHAYSQFQAHGWRGAGGTQLNSLALNWTNGLNAVRLGQVNYTGLAGTLNNSLGSVGTRLSSGFSSLANNEFVRAGFINGATNTLADIAFNYQNPSVDLTAGRLFRDFSTGFLGGAAGKYISPKSGAFEGMLASGMTESLDQGFAYLKGDSGYEWQNVIGATAFGGSLVLALAENYPELQELW